MFARIFTFLLTTFYLILTPLPAFAQSATNSANSLPTTISPTSPLYTDMLVHNMFHTFSCLAVGSSVIGQPCLTYQITKNAQGIVQSIPVLSQVNLSGGALEATTSLIGALYANPPVRTADYLASVGTGLGIVKEANAQVVGSGAQVLSPILTLWQVSRNIAYLIMIIIFVIIGLMVMFRNRINPQTVITAQAALPGLVIGLILVTFSYFLAGLISDTAFIGTNVVGYYFAAAQGPTALADTDRTNLVQKMSKESSLSIFGKFTGIVDAGAVGKFVDTIWQYLDGGAKTVVTALAVFITAQTVTQSTDFLKLIPKYGEAVQAGIVGLTAIFATASPSSVIGPAVSFIASLVLLYTMLRLLIRLVNSYLTIIFLTFTAPFQFLAAALPGRQGIATDWILNILGNILAFPAVLAVFYFVAFILGQSFGPLKISSLDQRQDNTFVSTAQAIEIDNQPNMIVGKDAFPLFGGIDLSFIKILLAFGALVATPAIPDIIIRTVGKASQAGQLIGQEIGAGVGAGQRYAGQAQQGVGSASGQLARTRGLFNTPGYKSEMIPGTESNPQYRIVETYEAGRGATFGALTRRGISKAPKAEPSIR